ncbi:S-adenosylmethionine:tRNA ribosyltransferase-isomerase [Marinoscillum pacificum]|uniref:S-adenosylmethionine:tRNA ribosyltransferase-isomerase n=1 Tax=Marinoscillum pacificum TaxID=392723 RepID=UPI002157C2AA|nr:S-adenosylmethionine:tRNA ribosyltransferase-isomerase [Marinoscillum pacificum]
MNLQDYTYDLPDSRIAKHPLKERDASKLLYYHKGEIHHHQFSTIPDLLPEKSLLVFNDTKVIPARLIMNKETGARIEIFLLEPILPSNVHEQVMSSKLSTTWKVMIGNSKKWKEGTELTINLSGDTFQSTRLTHDTVRFDWSSDLTFSEILLAIGQIPLPPYLGRSATEEDVPRYQTVYSKNEGAVAAPTAGLHFTDRVLDSIASMGIQKDFLTLHVSAGTFQPIKSETIEDHPMHREQVHVSRSNIETLLQNETIIPVGTTSMRTLESLYWFGQLLEEDENAEFFIKKETAYSYQSPISLENSLTNILNYLTHKNQQSVIGQTEIFIYPGYQFRVCNGLVTNFHQPGSTLILLVAALIGNNWKRVYDQAMNNDYRFLSYGDSSLLIP